MKVDATIQSTMYNRLLLNRMLTQYPVLLRVLSTDDSG